MSDETLSASMAATMERIARWQKCGTVHPLTCGTNSDHAVLEPRPREDGGVFLGCPDCDYTQTWIPSSVLCYEPPDLGWPIKPKPSWLDARPTEPGWYWVQDGDEIAAVKVTRYLGGGGDILRVEGHGRLGSVRLEHWKWWSEPLTTPEAP